MLGGKDLLYITILTYIKIWELEKIFVNLKEIL